ncbi:DNA segregation ATPase, FtsK/SpoIIIE family [Rivularia sp. PCC 7116]|uniref:DNA translocase FtsK n=1 Tax=Rivularia sp. PCC 7116 TaxID=373994 RepID=UPI00029F38D3|nr:DNA translocase FtsK [Rivularia sp. PCC 7116]AFY54377.1 DNA segregation ATPase, FtsK/SpoIIIE family [Rivularia sp. PCC 7116]
MLAAGDEHNSIQNAIIYAYNQGLAKDDILEVVNFSLPDDLHNKAISIIENINSNCNSKLLYFNDLPELFNLIFNLVNQGFSEDDILNQLFNKCDLEQFEFAKYALRYIAINRIPSVWELDNVYNELIKLDINELIKRCEAIKNLQNKQVAYRIILQNFYNAFCDGEPIKWFTDIARSTTDETIIKYCDRAAVMISKAQGVEPINALESAKTDIEQLSISTTESGKLIINTLAEFKIAAEYIDAQCGPTFNRIKIKLGKGVSFKKIQDFGNDFVQQLGDTLNMDTSPMVSVVRGGAAIDIPRSDREIVYFKNYADFSLPIDIHNVVIPGGVGVDGKYVDIPLSDENVTHILGGGRTRGGKSQFEKAAILYLARRYPPSVVKLALSDVKRVTFSKFSKLPHLIAPVAKDAASSAELFSLLVQQMEARYREFEKVGCETIAEFNRKHYPELIMPRIASFTDECFDLLTDKDYCDSIELDMMKLLAKAGGAGIDIMLYTQRPDKNVINPLIRSNFPAKTAFATTRPEDSCIILGDDNTLAANLLGYGDFLYKTSTQITRLQALYVGDAEEPEYFEQLLEEAINQEDNFTAWEPNNIEEFSDSGIGSKAILNNDFAVEVNLDEQSKNSILNLYSKGYAIHEIIKAIFNITRQDGKDYKKYRSAVENFLNNEGNK